MRKFYLSNEEVTEIDGSEAWAIVEDLADGNMNLYQIGFRDKKEAAETLKRVIVKYADKEMDMETYRYHNE